MLDSLFQLDLSLFHLMNGVLTTAFLDRWMGDFTDLHKVGLVTQLPMIIGVLYWVYRQRVRALKVLLLAGLSIGLTDLVSYHGIKRMVKRPRPHHRVEWQSQVKVDYGPKSPSFPSNHAANSMALMNTLALVYPASRVLFYTYTGLIGYSRVYVGVHFPSDVVAGWILGFLLSYLLFRLIGPKLGLSSRTRR